MGTVGAESSWEVTSPGITYVPLMLVAGLIGSDLVFIMSRLSSISLVF